MFTYKRLFNARSEESLSPTRMHPVGFAGRTLVVLQHFLDLFLPT